MIGQDIMYDLLIVSPFIITILLTILLYGMLMISLYTRKWEMQALSLIPLTFDVLYFWIGTINPAIEVARGWVRIVLGFSVGIALVVVFTYLKELRRKGDKR